MTKLKFSQRLSKMLELPADGMLPVPRLEIIGRDDVLISGSALLLEYSPERIRISRGGCGVTICGADLRLLAMDKMGIQVAGRLTDVRFDGEGDGPWG